MESIVSFLKTLKENNGEPREGFEDYWKKCKLVDMPTSEPELSQLYEIPEGEILHKVMVQPFYDGRVIKARPTDIIVTSYPKTGTTWTQEISFLVASDANFEKAKSAPTEERFPFIEIPVCGIKGLEGYEDPRLIKTHLPYDFLPKSFIENKTKMVYIIRNPRDTIVSFYHFLKMVGYVAYSGTFEDFVNSFCQDRLLYSSYARNVLSYWNRRNEDHILILFYEDLQKDLKANVKKIMTFLGKSFPDDVVNKIVEHVTFDNMKANPMANYSHGGACIRHPDSTTEFLRKGKTGDWRNHFTDELLKKVDAYVDKHFAGTGIEFQYDV